ncbi:MAG: hypothetical protein IKE59_01795 [Erysipelotrichaceae bacterium]|nr:hypothetical protein [Erysipelotrichaceae bacterium]
MKVKVINNNTQDTRQNCDAYCEAMIDLMKENDKIVHIDCDLLGCINGKKMKEEFPERVLNAGIAEQNAVALASGMAAAGMIPFVHTFGVFASRRAFDQAFLSAGYSRWPVHIIGTDPGVTAGVNGATHMPLEDCGIYLNIPNVTIVDPADYAQTYALTKEVAKLPEITYLRLIRRGFKTVYADGSEFEIGKGVVLKEGTDVTLIASGIMVNNALQAEKLLAAEGISASVIDMFTWKPLDEELIISEAKKTGAIVSCENHQLTTGLGSAIANVLARNCPVPQEFIGVPDCYGIAAPQSYLEEKYHMTAEDIAKAAVRAIKRKNK